MAKSGSVRKKEKTAFDMRSFFMLFVCCLPKSGKGVDELDTVDDPPNDGVNTDKDPTNKDAADAARVVGGESSKSKRKAPPPPKLRPPPKRPPTPKKNGIIPMFDIVPKEIDFNKDHTKAHDDIIATQDKPASPVQLAPAIFTSHVILNEILTAKYVTETPGDYPADMNPFGDEEDDRCDGDHEVKESSRRSIDDYPEELNPFADDEDVAEADETNAAD